MTWQHDDPGTPEQRWSAAAPWRGAAVLRTAQAGHLVVLAAHPDDETLGAAGLIALAARDGWDVDVVVASDGEASHPTSPTHDRQQLATRRAGEVRAAVGRLAPDARLHRLGLPDGALSEHQPALHAAVLPLLTGRTPTWLVAPWRGDQHPDHAAVGQVATDLTASTGHPSEVSLLEYPVWAWHWADPDDGRLPWDRARVLPLDPTTRAAKAAAMAEHRSQVARLSERPGDEALLPAGVLEHFRRDVEVFWLSGPAR